MQHGIDWEATRESRRAREESQEPARTMSVRAYEPMGRQSAPLDENDLSDGVLVRGFVWSWRMRRRRER